MKRQQALSTLRMAFVFGSVVMIVGIVVMYILMNFARAARDEQRIRNLAQIAGAIEQYYKDHKKYPLLLQFGSSLCTPAGCPTKTYLETIPKDPLHFRYMYRTSTNRQYYYLYSCLEKKPKQRLMLTIDCNCPLPSRYCDYRLTNQP